MAGFRAFLDDNGNGKPDPGEPTTYRTLPDGGYILPIPTRYQVAGGELPPLVHRRADGRGLHRRRPTAPHAACTRAPAR